MNGTARALLIEWLNRRLDDATQDWLVERMAALTAGVPDRELYKAFSLVPRHIPHGTLGLNEIESVRASECLPGWMPQAWTLVDAGRILLLTALPHYEAKFAPRFRSLCQTADVAESVSLYRGLPLYPEPAKLEPQVAEGLRTNMRNVFEAIAHHNPYPCQIFDEHRWNHMVLKALFIQSRLAPIQGLDERANPELARIMRDFAHERRAAGRPIPAEIWRCMGPFAVGAVLADLERVLKSGTTSERQAAVLALLASPDPAAAELLKWAPDLAADAASGKVSWAMIQ
jgi:hypothetical protein